MTMVPASSLAAEIGNPRLANVVLLGTPSHSLDIPVEIWDGTMGDRVEDKYRELNRRAFQVGREAATANVQLLPNSLADAPG